MNHTTTKALALALAVTASPVLAQDRQPMPPPAARPQMPNMQVPQGQGEQPTPKDGNAHPSKQAIKALQELQKAIQANDTAAIPAKIAAAKAVAATKDDRYIIGQMQLKVALAANDTALMASAIDDIADSGFIAGSTGVAELYLALGSKLYNAKQFDRAAAAFERASALDPSNFQVMLNLAEARFQQGRKADAVALFKRSIDVRTAAGQKPEEALYKRAVGVAYDAKMPMAIDLARDWISAYPSPQSWRNGLALYQNLSKPDVEGALNVLRLMRATGSLNTVADYSLYASAAAEQLNFNEAQAVIDEGLAKQHFKATDPLIRDVVNGLKAKQKATEADLVDAAKNAQRGMALLRIGDRYYGMGNFTKAAELYRQSMGKAGVDSSLANLHLGMALAQSGDKAGATAAFNAVSGELQGVAKYWLIYVQQRG